MKNIIELLEKMGKDVSMLDPIALEQAIAKADLTPELSDAVKVGDVKQVEMLLGKNGDIFCNIKEADEPEQEDEPSEEVPKKEQSAINY